MPKKANPAGGRRGARCNRYSEGCQKLHCPCVNNQASQNRPPTPYEKLFRKLTPREQRRVNEAMVAAVNRCTDMNSAGPIGTKLFLESRAIQLAETSPKIGWKTASKRFRDAVSGWAERHPVPGLGTHNAHPVNSHEISQQKQCQKTPNFQVEDAKDSAEE